jgi:hypothetical protein
MQHQRKTAFLVPARVLVDAQSPEDALAQVQAYLGRIDGPLLEAAVAAPVPLPDAINTDITAGRYRDGDAFIWHDRICEIDTRVAIG